MCASALLSAGAHSVEGQGILYSVTTLLAEARLRDSPMTRLAHARLASDQTQQDSGGAAGEPPPGSEKPNRRFLQAQHRFCLERVSFSVQESDTPHPRLSFGHFSERSPHPSRTC